MSECCPGGFITPRDAANIALNYVYGMYRGWEWNMYRVGLRVVRVYRYGCVYNVLINVTLTSMLSVFNIGKTVRRTHHIQVDPCTGAVVGVA